MNLKKTLLVGSLFCGVYVFPLYAETPYSESETIEQQKGIRVSGTVIDKEKNTLVGVNINERFQCEIGTDGFIGRIVETGMG